MRSTSLVTISLPPKMLSASQKAAASKNMTRSELVRTALRRYLEELDMEKVIKAYQKEKREGKLKSLKGSLANLIG